jgi:hypothetical protein
MFNKKFKYHSDETEDIVSRYDIKVPTAIAGSYPSQEKIDYYTDLYLKLGHLDTPITVIAEINEKNKPNKLFLVDGYIRYLIAKRFDIVNVPVKYIEVMK